MKYKVLPLLAAALVLVSCDAEPSQSDIEKSVNNLAATSPVMKSATPFTVKDTYCSESNGAYACAATASDGKTSYKTQLRMVKQDGNWKSEFLSPPAAIP